MTYEDRQSPDFPGNANVRAPVSSWAPDKSVTYKRSGHTWATFAAAAAGLLVMAGCASSPRMDQVAELKQQCVREHLSEAEGVRAAGGSSGYIHSQCAMWAQRMVTR